MDAGKPGRGRQPRFQAPDIPREKWCQARRLYEEGLTLSQIGERLHCDPRTARSCILRNSDELDQRSVPRLLDPYMEALRAFLVTDEVRRLKSVRKISMRAYGFLIANTDYPGSEKTIRALVAKQPPKDPTTPVCDEPGEDANVLRGIRLHEHAGNNERKKTHNE